MDFIKGIMSNSLVQARVLSALRGASMAAGAWALTSTYVYLTTHIHSISQADAMSIAGVVSATVAGLILTIGSTIFSQFVVAKVDAKITTAAVTGSVAAANDPVVVAQVKAASGSPEALQQVVATLGAGKE